FLDSKICEGLVNSIGYICIAGKQKTINYLIICLLFVRIALREFTIRGVM
ncbi:MAG: hypothetical protein ACI9S8_002304, partial [Chlamydiales bacterium]